MEYYSTIKNNEILPFAPTKIDLEGIMLSEIGQTKTYTVGSLLYVESKNNNNNKTKTKLIENRLVVARGGDWRWRKWVKGKKKKNERREGSIIEEQTCQLPALLVLKS